MAQKDLIQRLWGSITGKCRHASARGMVVGCPHLTGRPMAWDPEPDPSMIGMFIYYYRKEIETNRLFIKKLEQLGK